mgnify:CR=1 FL=1
MYQDESNMAAMLLYKHGHSEEYKMVRHESYVSTACKPVSRPGSQNIPTLPLFLPSLQTLHITHYMLPSNCYLIHCVLCLLAHSLYNTLPLLLPRVHCTNSDITMKAADVMFPVSADQQIGPWVSLQMVTSLLMMAESLTLSSC